MCVTNATDSRQATTSLPVKRQRNSCFSCCIMRQDGPNLDEVAGLADVSYRAAPAGNREVWSEEMGQSLWHFRTPLHSPGGQMV